MQTFDELLAEANQHYAMAHHHLGKVKIVLDLMFDARPASRLAPVTSPVRCVREWVDWLSANGPAIKNDIHEGTGIKFTERGSKYTVEWARSLNTAPDDQFAPNTLMKISAKAKGRGAPPKVYFLWSQRWDVHPLFDVGPVAGEDLPAAVEDPQVVDNFEEEVEEHEADTPRFATLEEWDEAWAPTFDALVASETKPTDAQKQEFYETLPEGADGNAAIAIAYREALTRSRQPQTLLGVIHPPETQSNEIPLDWDDEI